MSKSDVYPPIQLLQSVSHAYPHAWERMADFHRRNGQDGLPSWPEWCYAPFSAAIAVATGGNLYDLLPLSLAQMSQCIAALAPWRQSKEVYVVDPDLASALYAQGDDLDVPGDFLLQLPYPAFYVEAPGLNVAEQSFHGFVVHLEYDIHNGDRELRFLYVPKSKSVPTFGLPVHIDNCSLSESVSLLVSQAKDQIARSSDDSEKRDLSAAISNSGVIFDILKKSLQLVLYILASNAEIAPDREQATVTHRSKTIHDQYREIRKWDVGYRTGAAIRAQQSSTGHSSTSSVNSRMPPRPHLRRGHWHHYWTGPKGSPDARKLILKWLSPVAVGTSDADIVVFHPVK